METGVVVRSAAALRAGLARLDGRGYKAYKALLGAYDFPSFRLCVDHVQADPFASPSHLRVRVHAATAGIPRELYRDRTRRVALQDFLIRAFAEAIREVDAERGERARNGLLAVDCGGQEILERSAARLGKGDGEVEIRCVAGLPGEGRRIAGEDAIRLLCEDLPRVVERSLLYRNLSRLTLRGFVECAEEQVWLRRQLDAAGLVAFVGDGALLPRRSGCDDRPLDPRHAVPFVAPPSLRVSLDTPNGGSISGLGIPRGVTLIVGGGFHGKSTLLNALERGVYNHVPDDGRERVVTVTGAMRVRAEDGRYVNGVDISPFIGNLPGGVDTRRFCTENASGSTSQAAGIVEAIELGATCLLMDEDTCAANFMIRDERMQALVAPDKEPIIPFVERVADLYRDLNVSTVLVMGGSGAYFAAANTVIMMDEWRAVDRTADARGLAGPAPAPRRLAVENLPRRAIRRVPHPESIDPSRGRREVKVNARSLHRLQFGAVEVDLAALTQLVDVSQTRAVGEILVCLRRKLMDGQLSLVELLDRVCRVLDTDGLDVIAGRPVGYLAMPRRLEIGAVLNRMRGVKFRQA